MIVIKRPQVGAGVVIIQHNKILLAKRKGSHGAGMWGSAGGHVEFGERPSDTAKREAYEELGIRIEMLQFLCCINYVIEDKHYLDIGFTAKIRSGIPTIQPKETDRIEVVDWFSLHKLPTPLFPPVTCYLKALNTGKIYFEL